MSDKSPSLGQKYLEFYGTPLVDYQGKGWADFNSRRKVEVIFRCVQLSHSLILVYLEVESAFVQIELTSTTKFVNITQVYGTLDDGRFFKTNGELLSWDGNLKVGRDSSNKLEVLLHAYEVIVSVQESKEPSDFLEPSKLVFPVTNLSFFEGNLRLKKSNGQDVPVQIFEIEKERVILSKHENYENLVKEMQATRESIITSELRLDFDGTNLEAKKNIIDNLCALLTFAVGPRIIWPYYQLFTEDGDFLFSLHRRIFMSGWGALGVITIDPSYPADLKGFIEAVYKKFVEIKDDYKLLEIIDTIAQSKGYSNFGELNALNIGSAVDVLRGRWALHNKSEWVLDPAEFEPKLKEFKKEISNAAKNLFGLNRSKANTLSLKAKELNRRAFRNVLEIMCNDLKASISPDEIRCFIKSRDYLTHQGTFFTLSADYPDDEPFLAEAPQEELYLLYSVIDRLVLGLLNYNGPYFDRLTLQRIEPKTGNPDSSQPKEANLDNVNQS